MCCLLAAVFTEDFSALLVILLLLYYVLHCYHYYAARLLLLWLPIYLSSAWESVLSDAAAVSIYSYLSMIKARPDLVCSLRSMRIRFFFCSAKESVCCHKYVNRRVKETSSCCSGTLPSNFIYLVDLISF